MKIGPGFQILFGYNRFDVTSTGGVYDTFSRTWWGGAYVTTKSGGRWRTITADSEWNTA